MLRRAADRAREQGDSRDSWPLLRKFTMGGRDSRKLAGAFGCMVHGAIARISPSALAIVMLCAITVAAPGCGGTKPTIEQVIQSSNQRLRQAVSSNVADEGRKAQMLMLVDQIETVQSSLSKETADFVQNYRKLNADYDTPRAAFDQLFSDYNGQRIKARNQAIDLHFQLASLATASEWDPIGKAEVKLYEEVSEARAGKGGK
jgi:hypothetical protein